MVELGSLSSRPKTFDGVQCLRFVAAMMVVLTHSTFYASERLEPGSYVWYSGTFGVDIFFVISGFVMYVSSIHLEGQPGGWKEFARKRLIRVVPLYWAVTTLKLLILVSAPAVVLHSQLDWGYILKSYLFIPAYSPDGDIEPLLGVGWTLNFEMFFYALFTLTLFLRVPVLPTLAVVLILCAAGSLIRQEDWPAWAFYLDIRVIEFLAGMLIAKFASRSEMPTWIAAGAIAVGFAVLILLPIPEAGPGRLFTVVLPATLIVLGVVAVESKFGHLLPRWMVFLGAASYSLYLIHPIASPAAPALLAKLNLPYLPLAILGSVIIALVSSVIVYVFFEKPVTKALQHRRTLNGQARKSLL